MRRSNTPAPASSGRSCPSRKTHPCGRSPGWDRCPVTDPRLTQLLGVRLLRADQPWTYRTASIAEPSARGSVSTFGVRGRAIVERCRTSLSPWCTPPVGTPDGQYVNRPGGRIMQRSWPVSLTMGSSSWVARWATERNAAPGRRPRRADSERPPQSGSVGRDGAPGVQLRWKMVAVARWERLRPKALPAFKINLSYMALRPGPPNRTGAIKGQLPR